MKYRRIFLMSLFSLIHLCLMAEKVEFGHRFNPMNGLVNEVETQRDEICLNGSWDFMPIKNAKAEDFAKPSEYKAQAVKVKIPSPWNVNNFTNKMGGDFKTYPSYPKEWNDVKIGWLKKQVQVPNSWKGQEVFLHFKGVMGKAKIYVNNKLVGENFELFLPFSFNVTKYLKPGKNEILVGVAKGTLFNQPGKYGRRIYVGGSMWGKEMVGIWQDVYLLAKPKVHVVDAFVKPFVGKKQLTIEVNVQNNTKKAQTVTLDADISKWMNLAGKSVVEAPVQKGKLAKEVALKLQSDKVTIKPHSSKKIILTQPVKEGELDYWTPKNPNLYGAVVQIKSKRKTLDTKYQRFGWREFTINGTDLLLNGKKIVLRGDSWHFLGVPQMTRRYAWAWYQMLKDCNANAVRLHAQPYPEFYLDVADEMGICVLDETAIWSSDGGPKIDSEEYWNNCKTHVRKLVARDKNHPSVFGWSVCNETLPVAVHVFHAPEKYVQRQVDEINNWIAITKEMDDTRDWISGDGETMRKTDLPTVIGHYGDLNSMKNWASQNMPWGIGETSMAYYGTPLQISKINGDRAFESVKGRMEGLALECYDLLKKQQQNKASYQSVFNIVWYGLKPLNLGKKQKHYPAKAKEGIFFGYKEGVPGMQPERLGPYCTTLNPGYDKALPLYKPWPMFKAVKAANNGKKFALPVPKRKKEVYNPLAIKNVQALSANKQSSVLLESFGVKLDEKNKFNKNTFVYIDASKVTNELIQDVKKAVQAKSTLYIANPSLEGLNKLSKVLPLEIQAKKYEASSFVVNKYDPAINGLGNKYFYFTELLNNKKSAINVALKKSFGKKGHVILATCQADWSKWNYKPETVKTAAVYRSEFERGTKLPVLTVSTVKGQVIYINTLSQDKLGAEYKSVTKQLLNNIGVPFEGNSASNLNALSETGVLVNVLHHQKEVKATNNLRSLLNDKQLENEVKLTPSLLNGEKAKWEVLTAKGNQFSHEATLDKATIHYYSFWCFSPRSLTDLLIEPDMPEVNMSLKGAESIVYINGKKYTPAGSTLKNVKFEKGWNHCMIKAVQKVDKAIDFKVMIQSNKKDYMSKLSSVLER